MPQEAGAVEHGPKTLGCSINGQITATYISFKELFALVLAAAVWGRGLNSLMVQWRCNNQAAVRVLSTWRCRDAPMMHLLRCLFFYEAYHMLEGFMRKMTWQMTSRVITISLFSLRLLTCTRPLLPYPISSQCFSLDRATGYVLARPAPSSLHSPESRQLNPQNIPSRPEQILIVLSHL